MEAPIEISYAGVVVGRAQEVRSTDRDAEAFFLSLREPMPVGTVVGLRSGGQETPARVVRTVEAADAAGSGMQVRLIGDAEVAAPEWIPPPAKAKSVAPTPSAESVSETVEAGHTKNAETSTPGSIAEAAPAAPTETAAEDATAAESGIAIATGAPTSAVDPPPAAVVENPSNEATAIPEAVPVTVGSSMTGALENATETLPYGQPVNDSARAEAAAESSGVATESGTAASEPSAAEELPPARPVAGPSGRRRTKRRK